MDGSSRRSRDCNPGATGVQSRRSRDCNPEGRGIAIPKVAGLQSRDLWDWSFFEGGAFPDYSGIANPKVAGLQSRRSRDCNPEGRGIAIPRFRDESSRVSGMSRPGCPGLQSRGSGISPKVLLCSYGGASFNFTRPGITSCNFMGPVVLQIMFSYRFCYPGATSFNFAIGFRRTHLQF